MLNISGVNTGVVIDHIEAGTGMEIYSYLGLDKYEKSVALIKNASSTKMGRKDIIKIEGLPDNMNLDLLSILGNNITINIIKDGKIVEKRVPSLPETIKGVFVCKNPRCITSVERGLPHIFKLTNPEKKTYRCIYCEQAYHRHG